MLKWVAELHIFTQDINQIALRLKKLLCHNYTREIILSPWNFHDKTKIIFHFRVKLMLLSGSNVIKLI